MAGHAQTALAIVFGAEKSPFSDAAQRAIDWGTRHYIAPDWREIFSPDRLREAISEILPVEWPDVSPGAVESEASR